MQLVRKRLRFETQAGDTVDFYSFVFNNSACAIPRACDVADSRAAGNVRGLPPRHMVDAVTPPPTAARR